MNYLTSRDELLRRANTVMDGILEGWLQLRISHIFPLDQTEKPQHLLENRQSSGKMILKIEN